MHQLDDIATKLQGWCFDALDERTRRVARHVAERTPVSRNVVQDAVAGQSMGQSAADAVAWFGGSWTFVGLFGATMLLWVALNALLLATRSTTFDPYPFMALSR